MLFEWSPAVLCEMDITGLLRMAGLQKGGLDEAQRILKERWPEARGGIRLTGMNAAARKFFGVDPSQSVPNGRMQAAEKVLAGLLAGDMKCIISGKTTCKGESRLDMGKDSSRFVEWCWARSPRLEGADLCLVSLADITGRKRAEEALHASEGLYRALVENIHLGINLIDRDHRILKVNSTTCDLFRKPSAAFVGKRCFRLFEKRDRVCSHCPGKVAMATNQPAEAESEVVWADGSRYCVRIQAFPVLDTDGQAEAFIEVVEDITDRKRAHEALRESEEKYRQIFAMETDGIFLVNAQTHRFLDVNDAACRMYGHTREEFLNLIHLDTTTQPKESAESIAEVIREKRVFVALRYHKKKDGTAFPVEISASSFDLQGQPVICGVIRDITQRKRAGDAMRESESRYRSLFENMVEGFAYCQMIFEDGRPVDFVYLAVNEAFETLTGLKNVVGQKVSDLIPGLRESDAELLQVYGRVARTGKPQKIEIFVHAMAMWFSVSVYSPKKDHFVAVFDVITERKRLEEERQRLTAILEATTDYVGFADAGDLHICYTNPAGRKMVGFGPDEDVTKIKIEALHPDWVNKMHLETILPIIRRDGIWSGESAFLHRDGHEIPVLMVSLAHKDSSGEVKYFSTISRDITQLRKTEAQLRQAQKMEAVGQLAGGVAHDFRNQLTVIKGYGEMLLRRSLVKDEGKEQVGQILQAAERSAAIAGQLLAFSRQQVLRPEVVSLDSLAGDMMKSVAKALGEDIRLAVMPRGDLWNVRLDTGQFQQALLNLVLNARDAMPKGGLLKIETHNTVLDESFVRQHAGACTGRYAMLTVRDTGTGMSPDTLSHLFEPFFTTKPVGEGTGLGLAMVHGFVTQSGGFIDVQSEPRQGTAFRLYFPAVEDAGESAGTISQATDLPKGFGTILVVEDEDPIRRMLMETLCECGYTVLPVGNAQDAMVLAQSARQKIDLLITDVVMPGRSGPELAKDFRKARPGVPVLLISGHAGKMLAGHGVIPADVNLLTKPFTSQALAQAVGEALRQSNDPENGVRKNVPKPRKNKAAKKMKE
jgi:PAS domain S-box-containing protein